MPILKNIVDYQKIGTEHQDILIDKIIRENKVSRHHAITILNGLAFIENQKPIVCRLCPSGRNEVSTGNGLILKECLHHFCKQCLSRHIYSIQTSAIPCPYVDGASRCPENLQPSEVEALVPQKEYDRHYMDLFFKEIKACCKDVFHCQRANCKGFCILEGDSRLQFFECPVCGTENCRKCKKAHGWRISCAKHHESLYGKDSSCNIF